MTSAQKKIVDWAGRQAGARDGALLSVRECRAAVALSSGRFDVAVLALADAGVIAIHHTDGAPGRDYAGLVADPDRRDHAGRPGLVIGFSLRD